MKTIIKKSFIIFFLFVFYHNCTIIKKNKTVDSNLATKGSKTVDPQTDGNFNLETFDWAVQLTDKNSDLFKAAKNPKNASAGKQVFKSYCAICHGQQAQGAIGPNLTDAYWLNGSIPSAIASTITYGVREKGMPTWRNILTPTQVGALVAYIRSTQGSNPPDAKAPQGIKE